MRLVGYKLEDKNTDLDWQDIVDYCGLNVHKDVLRKAVQPQEFGAYAVYQQMLESDFEDEDIFDALEAKKREVYIEQQKLRDTKNEYKSYLREVSRAEHLEKIIEDAFKKKEPTNIQIPKLEIQNRKKEIVVAFTDSHYGADFCLKDFFGNIMNEYNKEIFMERMFKLAHEIEEFAELVGTNKLRIVDGGDTLEGKLHLSQLQSLKSDVVDDIIDYADFIVEWLNYLSEKFIIDMYTSQGNHSDMRIMTGKKGDFPNENLERIYFKWLEKNMESNPNVTINANKDGLNYFDVLGYKFLTAHGQDEKGIMNSIGKYENLYKVPINYFIVGHLHSKLEGDVSDNKEVIQVRSVMGMNDYAEKIGKNSPAGALMFTVEEGLGKKIINEVKFQ